MELNIFRNNTRVTFSDEDGRALVAFVVDKYKASTLPFYSEDKSLMACMDLDKSFEGKIDVEENNDFINELMLNMCFDFSKGKDKYMELPEDKQVQMGEVFFRKINGQVQKSDIVVYDASGVREDKDYLSMEHEFIIKVMPVDFISSVRYLYEEMRKQNLNDFRIVTPATRFICAGYNAPIRLKCKTKDLDKMISFLDDVSIEFIRKTQDVLPIHNIAGSWYGYEQVLDNGKTSTSTICNAIYDAIVNVVSLYVQENDVMMEKGLLARDYLADFKNKYVAIRKVLSVILENDYDVVISQIVEETKNRASYYGINLADCLRFESVNREVSKIYGKEMDVQSMINTRQEQASSFETPVEVMSYVPGVYAEETRLDNLAKQAEEDYQASQNKEYDPSASEERVKEEVAKAQEAARKKIEERKKYLESLIDEAKVKNFPSGYENEEDMDNALKIVSGEREVQEDGNIVNVESASNLEDSFKRVLNGESPETVGKYNDALQEYQDLLEMEKRLDESQETLEEPGEELLTPGDLQKTSDAIDNAIAAIIMAEENEARRAQENARGTTQESSDLVAEGGTESEESTEDTQEDLSVDETKFDVDSQEIQEQVSETPTTLDAFSSGKTEVLTDVVTSVSETLKEDKQKLQENDLSGEAVCLDYFTEDEVLIPDLKSVAYRGNDLKMALETGGFLTDDDYIAKIAEHFGMSNYSSKPEEMEILLSILRNLNEYNQDGTKKNAPVNKVDEERAAEKVEKKDKKDNALQDDKETLEPDIISRLIKAAGKHLDAKGIKRIVDEEDKKTKKDDSQATKKEESAFVPQLNYALPIQPIKNVLRDSYKYKYSGYVEDTSILDSEVANTNYTVLDYFEYYDLFNIYRSDSVFVLHEESKEITGKEFTTDYLINYLTNYGPGDLEYIVSLFAEEIKPPKKHGR